MRGGGAAKVHPSERSQRRARNRHTTLQRRPISPWLDLPVRARCASLALIRVLVSLGVRLFGSNQYRLLKTGRLDHVCGYLHVLSDPVGLGLGLGLGAGFNEGHNIIGIDREGWGGWGWGQ